MGDDAVQAERDAVIRAAYKAASNAVQSKTPPGGRVHYSWEFEDDALRAALDVLVARAKVEALSSRSPAMTPRQFLTERYCAAESELADALRRREGAA